MPVTEAERAFDRHAAGIVLQAKGAKAKPRQADALGLQIFHEMLLTILHTACNHPIRERRCRLNVGG